MQKITPFIWLNTEAEEAARFYTSLFPNSSINGEEVYGEAGSEVSGQETGSVMTVNIKIRDTEMVFLNGGTVFKPNPSISFFIVSNSPEEIDRLYQAFTEDGKVLMPLSEYPFSKKYAWVEDRYGVSWQLFLGDENRPIIPSFLFTKDSYGKAEEAVSLYTSIFKDSSILALEKYGDEKPDEIGKVKYSLFTLEGQRFHAMESNFSHDFEFTDGVSLMVNCETQEEIDYYWDKLLDGGHPEQCGWLRDRYGVAWQIVPIVLGKLMTSGTKEQSERVMKAMLSMVKLDISELERAYNGE